MLSGTATNGRKVTTLVLDKPDTKFEHVPPAPFGALVLWSGKPERAAVKALAKRLIEGGCGWATLHAGKPTEKLHAWFDEAVVDHQLKANPDADMPTSGMPEDSLEEACRDAVFDAMPAYEKPFADLLVLAIGPQAQAQSEQAHALAQKVERE
ncbi:MAG: hypothetical protein KF754_10045 [Planctomycetes bacterium]|nr:hypothetical protein [Planctomycetota bacterium]